MDIIPSLPVADWFTAAIDWITENLTAVLNVIGAILQAPTEWLTALLLAPPALVLILLAGLLAFLARSWKFGLFTLLAFALLESMGQWRPAMQTLALVLVAAAFAAIVAIPVGILAARSNTASAVIRPLLDFMQTLHPFAYLVPVVVIFGIGVVPGIVATIIFGMPPGVRLTELGIRQVDKEMVEAGEAFGARPRQILTRIQFPLALPTILAGINQLIMLCLSMMVLAGIVGAEGLGTVIYTAIGTLDVGLGMEAGVAIVILAVFLDRLTAAVGNRASKHRQVGA